MLVSDHRFTTMTHSKDRLLLYQSSKRTVIPFFSVLMLILIGPASTYQLKISRYYEAGIIQCVLLSLIPFCFSQLSIYFLIRSWVFGTKFTYSGIWSLCFGNTLQFIPKIMVIFGFLGQTFSMISFVPLLWNKILIDIWDDKVPYIFTNDWFIMYIIGFVSFFPLLFVKRFSSLKVLAFIINFCAVVLIVCSIVNAILKSNEIDNKNVKLFGDYRKSMLFLYNFSFIFFIHPLLQMASIDLNTPTNTRIIRLGWAGNTIKFVFFNIMSILVYIWYYSQNEELASNDLNGFNLKMNSFTIVYEIIMYINVVMTLAYYEYILSRIVADLFIPESQSLVSIIMSGVCTFLLNCTIHFVSINIKETIIIIFSVSTFVLIFILPPLFSIVLYKTKDRLWFILAILQIVICSALILVIITIQSIHISNSW